MVVVDIAQEQIGDDGTTPCGNGDACEAGGRAVVWMLDLDAAGDPVAAHHVVSKTDRLAVTACGRTETPQSHPRGWWEAHPGQLPLAEHAVHCRRP